MKKTKYPNREISCSLKDKAILDKLRTKKEGKIPYAEIISFLLIKAGYKK